MSHSISARTTEGFKVEVRDYNDTIVHSAWYQDRSEAVAASQSWERAVMVAGGVLIPTLDEILNDEEFLKELMA